MIENRREFFRVVFRKSISGKLSYNGEAPMHIYIDDISVSGLRFTTSIEIPLHQKVECTFDIIEETFALKGLIIRKSRFGDDIEYGINFEIDQDVASHLFKQLNHYQIRQRRGTEMD